MLALPSCVVNDGYGYGSSGFVTQQRFVVGSSFNTLPVGYQSVFWNNDPYFVYGNSFFVRRNNQFVCVRRPAGPIFYRGGQRFNRHVITNRSRVGYHRQPIGHRYPLNRGFDQNRGPSPRFDDRNRGSRSNYRNDSRSRDRSQGSNRGSGFQQTVTAPPTRIDRSRLSPERTRASQQSAINRMNTSRTRGAPPAPRTSTRSTSNRGSSNMSRGGSRSSSSGARGGGGGGRGSSRGR